MANLVKTFDGTNLPALITKIVKVISPSVTHFKRDFSREFYQYPYFVTAFDRFRRDTSCKTKFPTLLVFGVG